MPATIEPPAVPIESSAAPSPTVGIDALMATLDAAALSGKNVDGTPADTGKPSEAPAELTPPSEVSKKTHDPFSAPEKPAAEPAKPVVPPADKSKPAEAEMSVEDMEKFLKAHPNKKPWKVYETLRTTTTAKVAELEGKLKTLESKAVEAPGDAAKIAAYEKQIEALTGESKNYKQRLAQESFKHTDAYKNFENRAQRTFQQGAAAIVAYQVTLPDGTTRAATVQDLDRLRRMDPADREDKLDEMFGPKARLVARYTDALDAVRSEADAAEEDYAKDHEKTMIQREMESKGQEAKFNSTYKAGLEQISKNPVFGKWFAADEADPEGTKLFRDGLAEIERIVGESENMSPEDAAAHAAVSRAKAAAMPRVLLAYNRLMEKYTAMESELAKFRSSDPGAKGATGGGGPVVDTKSKGIDELTATFDMDPGLVNRR
jgi:hypothetical protein